MTSVGYEQGFGTVIFFSANSDYLVIDPPNKNLFKREIYQNFF